MHGFLFGRWFGLFGLGFLFLAGQLFLSQLHFLAAHVPPCGDELAQKLPVINIGEIQSKKVGSVAESFVGFVSVGIAFPETKREPCPDYPICQGSLKRSAPVFSQRIPQIFKKRSKPFLCHLLNTSLMKS